jgi:hypothetical protein
MHKPLDRAPGIVADRIVAFSRIADELTRVRYELTRDWVGGIAGLDEVGQRRREPNRIALGDGLELRKSFPPGQSRFNEIVGGS